MARKTHHVVPSSSGWKVVKGGSKRASGQFSHKQVAVSRAREIRSEHPRNGHKLIDNMMQSNCWDVPADPLDQIRLMGLLTGSHRNFDSKAKATSKDTYVLIDAVHNFPNRAQHRDGQSIHLAVAVAAIMTCLQLLACLEREMGA